MRASRSWAVRGLVDSTNARIVLLMARSTSCLEVATRSTKEASTPETCTLLVCVRRAPSTTKCSDRSLMITMTTSLVSFYNQVE